MLPLCHHIDRVLVPLADPPRHDPRQAFMAFRQIDHINGILLPAVFLQIGHCRLHIFLGHVFPLIVQFFQFRRQPVCFRRIFRKEQRQGFLRRIQAPSGVEARSDHKTEMIAVETPRLQAVDANQCLQPRNLRMRHPLQAFLYQDPVLPLEHHHIAHGRQTCCLHKRRQLAFRNIRCFIQCFRQLIGHCRAAQAFERIAAACLMGIYHRVRRRKKLPLFLSDLFKGHLMMIRHQHRHTPLLCITDLFRRRDPVIAGQQGIHTGLRRQLDQMDVQPVAVQDPVWNIIIHIGCQPLQGFYQNIGGTHAVDVIISDDADPLFLPDLRPQDLHGLFHILHQKRRRAVRQRPMEILPDRLVTLHAAVPHDPRRHLVNPEAGGNALKIGLLRV